MKEDKPGHLYQIRNYAAKENEPPEWSRSTQIIVFMHRTGIGYPGNTGAPFDGTNCQELLRTLISRIKYLDGQISCLENTLSIADLRACLYRFELRAARRRGEFYLKEWQKRWFSLNPPMHIEEIDACETCGHILCVKHEKAL